MATQFVVIAEAFKIIQMVGNTIAAAELVEVKMRKDQFMKGTESGG